MTEVNTVLPGRLWHSIEAKATVDIHASRPGRPKCAAVSHLQQNPRIWRPALHQGDHTQLEVFPSEMRCRGVVLLASRIAVPSPATRRARCTLFTPFVQLLWR
eukprot:scaffold20353_cov72-Phaeocystis_antarctica.AAC.2